MDKTTWEWEIKPQTRWSGPPVRELWAYRDLLMRLVRREFLMMYQQTILGPLWILLQPLLTVLTYVLVFSKGMHLSTEGVPAFLYYLTGITLWNLFSDTFLGAAYSFQYNTHIFSKVYFPRIIVPLSILVLHLLRFLIQLGFLLIVLFYYWFRGEVPLHSGTWFLCLPAALATAGIALGFGLTMTVLTAKYRDLVNFVHLFIRLLMFVCPIFYSLANMSPQSKTLASVNPLAVFFEMFRYAFLGHGLVTGANLAYGSLAVIGLLLFGNMLFNKFGDKLMDVL